MNIKVRLLLTAACIILPLKSVEAGSRYSTPPAVVLSPDITQYMKKQLVRTPKNRNVVYQKKIVRRQVVRQKQTNRTAYTRRNKNTGTGIFALFSNKPFSAKKQRRVVRSVVVPQNQNSANSIRQNQVKPKKKHMNNATARAVYNNPADRPIDPRFLPQEVNYETSQKPGSIIINTQLRYLYLVLGNGKARRYGVGVGKTGFEWSGTEHISRKSQWPSWTPPKEMIAREAAKGHFLPDYMEGGPANPLGARALYLGSSLYRIHGTNQPWTIGKAVSSGCIRMRNEDVMDLYERAKTGAKVIVS